MSNHNNPPTAALFSPSLSYLPVKYSGPKEEKRTGRVCPLPRPRQWERYQKSLMRDNPIQTGLRYLQVFQDESVQTYAQAAKILGVSRERVYQLTALVTKLPAKIKDYLAGSKTRQYTVTLRSIGSVR